MLKVLSHAIFTIGGLIVGYLFPDTTSNTFKGLLLTLEAILIAVYFLIRRNLRDVADSITINKEKYDKLTSEITQVNDTVEVLKEKLEENNYEISELEKEKAQLKSKAVQVEDRTLEDASTFLKNL